MQTSYPKEDYALYDVLVAYNSADLEEVREIVALLKREGIQPWFDKDLLGGAIWMDHFAWAAQKVACAALIFGREGAGPWQDAEVKELLRQAVNSRKLTLIPVLLPGVSGIPDSLPFLNQHVRIEFNGDVNAEKEAGTRQELIDAIDGPVGEQRRKHAFEIEIDVPKAERSCFLAMRKKGLGDVYDAVKQAITALNGSHKPAIALKQTRDAGDSKTLTDDVIHAIRESEMVLAVCVSHETDRGCTPEVMYELGMAQALGKPTVLVTSQTDIDRCIPRLPWHSNLTFTRPEKASGPSWDDPVLPRPEIVEYKPNGTPTNGLAGRLQDAIARIVDRARDPYLVDPNVAEIHAIRSDLTRMRSVLWPYFHKVLSFGLKTHHETRDLVKHTHGLLVNVQKLVQIMEETPFVDPADDSFRVHCWTFVERYNALIELDARCEKRYFNQLHKLAGEVETTFKFFSRHLPDDLQPRMRSSEAWFRRILADYKEYSDSLKLVKKYAVDHFACFRQPRLTRDLESCARDVDDYLGLVYRDAHNMMSDLLEIIVKDGTHDHGTAEAIAQQSAIPAGAYQG